MSTTFPPFHGGPDEGGPGYGDRQYDNQQNYQPAQQQQHQPTQQPQQQQPQQNYQQQQYNQSQQRQEPSAGNSQRSEWQNNSNGSGSNWKGNGGNGGGGGGGWQNKQGGGGWQGKQGGGGGNFQKNRPVETDMTMYKPYVIAANPDAPPEILSKFQEIALFLESNGYTARVGGMEGIDEIIEKTVKKIEVHLPWREFSGKQSKFYYNTDRAFAVAKQFHPAFDTMKKGIQAFLAKNARLVMGDKMISPALFMLCWTEDGAETLRARTSRTGFAGHPIAIAASLGIPIFNLAKPDAQQRLTFLVESTHE